MSRRRAWRDAVAVLAAAGWEAPDIAAVLKVSVSTVYRMLGVRFWEVSSGLPAATCNHRVGAGYCDKSIAGGRAFCDEHWRLEWPQ